MSISLVYDGTTVTLDSDRVPDNPLDIRPIAASGVRRTYLGAAKVWDRFSKHTVGMTWTGIPSAVLGSLKALSDTTDTIYGTGFDANVFDSQYVNFVADKKSWTVECSGLNSYNATLRFEEV